MKKWMKILLVIVLLIGAGLAALYYSSNEALPTGKQGVEADNLANKMLNALNKEAYDSTQFIHWSFRGVNHYEWDKTNNVVKVSWEDTSVEIHPDNPSLNKILKGGNNLSVAEKTALFKKAQDNFNNDSFWLVAPYKVFDGGVERRLVRHKGKDALLITYTSGGTTPGDSYLWLLDDKGMPTSYKMWVSIIPAGGLEATWSDWKQTSTGAYLPTTHEIMGRELNMGDVKGFN